VNGVLLRPLPFPDSHELVTVDVMSFQDFYISTSIPNYNDWRDRARVFQSYGGQSSWGFKTTDTDVPELIPAEAIIGDFFRVLERARRRRERRPWRSWPTGTGNDATPVIPASSDAR
jgi:hypothetical protein